MFFLLFFLFYFLFQREKKDRRIVNDDGRKSLRINSKLFAWSIFFSDSLSVSPPLLKAKDENCGRIFLTFCSTQPRTFHSGGFLSRSKCRSKHFRCWNFYAVNRAYSFVFPAHFQSFITFPSRSSFSSYIRAVFSIQLSDLEGVLLQKFTLTRKLVGSTLQIPLLNFYTYLIRISFSIFK